MADGVCAGAVKVITPDTVKVVRGKGMPISKSPGQHGDLRIKFKVGRVTLAPHVLTCFTKVISQKLLSPALHQPRLWWLIELEL